MTVVAGEEGTEDVRFHATAIWQRVKPGLQDLDQSVAGLDECIPFSLLADAMHEQDSEVEPAATIERQHTSATVESAAMMCVRKRPCRTVSLSSGPTGRIETSPIG